MEKRGENWNKGSYKYLIIALIAIFFIALGWGILFILEKIPEKISDDGGFDEGLFTLGLWGEGDVVLEVLNFSISENNETANIAINWSSGEDSFDAVLFVFEKASGDCNYTSMELPTRGLIKTYSIYFGDTNCASNFRDATDISTLAGVDVVLIQTNLIENITFYNQDNLENVFDLDDYFSCIEDVDYVIFEDPSNMQIKAEVNLTTNRVSFYPEINWYGTQKFDLNAYCEGEFLNKSNLGDNMSFYVIILNETRKINSAPVFLSDNCGEWTIDIASVSDIEIDMEYCFEDSDNDPLTFRFDNLSMTRISVVMDTPYLTLTPDSSFIGSQIFYLYANDSHEETRSSLIYVYVISEGDGGVTLPVLNPAINVSVSINEGGEESDTNDDKPRIIKAEPLESEINISSEEVIIFSMVPENYDKREWYLDGELVAEDVNSYEAKNLNVGIHEIGARVKKGNDAETKIWNVNVSEKEFGKRNLLMIFIILACFLGLVILVVILLIIQGMRERYGMERDDVKLEAGPMPEYLRDVHP